MAPAWAAGLTVTTTGLNRQEKQAVKTDVEAAGGRYSPNLSKRTTHLVTPDVVGSLSDKLAAAAAAGSRFSAHIVSLGWVCASATSSGKAAEVQHAPALPGTQQTPTPHSEPATPATHLSSASSTQHVKSVVSAAAPTPGVAAAAAATAAPQTSWVVHFSQMVDDSVYGMPEQPSPTAHERLAEQLQEQQYQQQQLLLQPIAEEQSQGVSPAPACLPLQQHDAFGPGVSPAAAATAVYGMIQQQEAAVAGVQRTPAATAVTNAQRASAAAAGALTPRSHVQSTLQQCPTALPIPGMGHVLGASCAQHTANPAAAAAAAAAAFQQHPAVTSKADKSRAAFGSTMDAPAAIDRRTSNVPELMMKIAGNGYSNSGNGNGAASDINSGLTGNAAVQYAVPNGYRDNTAAAATGVPAPATVQPQVHEMLGEVQQQGWQQQLHQPAPADVSGGCGSVEELISALRQVTADGRRSTSEFTASPVPAVTPAAAAAAAATPGHGHFSPIQQQQQQMQTPATQGASAAGVGVVPAFGSKRHMNSTVDELIGALQRVADSSSRSAEETAPDAGGTGFSAEPQHQQGAAADGTLFGSFSSVDDLIVALRRATSDTATTAAAAQGTPQGSRHPIKPLPQQQQQQQRWPWEQAATTPQQQQQQDVQQRSAYAAECPVPVTPSNVDELILALRRVTGDSRRSTAEAAPSSPGGARWEPQQLWIGQQQGGLPAGALQAGSLFGSCGSVDDLLGALRRATGDSRRGTAESAPDVPAGTDDTAAAAAEAAGVVAAKQRAGSEQHPGVPAGPAAAAAATEGTVDLLGSFGGVDDLLGALRRATGDSRRGTADSAPDAQAVTTDKYAAVQGAEIVHYTGLSASVPAAGPAGLLGSMGGVDDLLCALRRATGDSRRGTAESAPDAPAGTDDTDTAAAAVLKTLANQKVEETRRLSGTATAAGAAAEPAGLQGILSSVDDLVQALRSATGDGRHDTRELVLHTGRGAAAATHLLQQQQQQQDEVGDHQQLQRSMAASDLLRRSSLSSCSSFEGVLGALLRATADSRRGTAEAVAEAAAVPLDLQPMQQQQQQQQQHALWQTHSTPGAKQPGTAGCSSGHVSGSSISALVTSLRRVTAETQGQLKTAAEALSPLPPQPGAAAAANTPAAAAAGSADMRELVAALSRVTGENHMAGGSNAGTVDSVTPNRLVLTPQAGGQALSGVQQEHVQQQQHAALIQQLLLHTQPGQYEEQLRTQPHRGRNSHAMAAWGSSGGEETPAATADVAAAATCSRGVEQLLAALQRSTVSSSVPAAQAADSWLYDEAAQHAEVDCAASRTSAELLAVLLQGQQQQLQQQQAANAIHELKVIGANSCCTPDSTAALLDITPAEHAAAATAQQQDHPGITAQLSALQSPLRARQLWQAEASSGAARACSQPELSLSQLVHALQSTGDQQTGRESDQAPSPTAPAAYTASTSAAAAAAAEGSDDWPGAISTVAAAAADALPNADGDSDECRSPTTTPHDEQQLPAAAEPPQQQKQHQQYQQAAAESPQQQPAAAVPALQLLQNVMAGAAAAAESPSQQQQAAYSTEAEAAAVPQQQQQQQQQQEQQQQEHPMPAVAAGSTYNPPDQQAPAAATGLQPCVSSMAVAFDHRLPAKLRKELAAAVAAAGSCVVPGQPHLGCGADTVVAQPQHAAQWLQLLMHIVSPAWLLKACMQQQQGCRPHQQLICLSADVGRALGQGTKQQDAHTGVQQHAGAAAGVDDSELCAAAGTINNCSSARTLETNSIAAAHSLGSNGPVAATAQEPGNCKGSSSSRACRAVLAVPGVLSVDGMGLCGVSAAAGTAAGDAGQLQQQPLLMPPGLLEGVVWSVDQDPRYVDDEEAEAVILQGTASSITLLLPQDSSGLLGHASVLVSPCQPCKGLTCSDVLQAIHSFYQQEVLLQQQQPAVAAAAAGVAASASNGGKCSEWQVHERGGVVVRRLQLLGARLMLEGLVRATRDPCSCVYEVCLA